MEKELEFIKDRIFVINEIPVMIDSDLAKFYGVETKRINEAVKNNSNKFPDRYSWKLSVDESNEILRSQISTSKIMDESSRSKFSTLNKSRGKNTKYGIRVFTEQGVAMLATILKSKKATEVTIQIIDAFVELRHSIADIYIPVETRFNNIESMLLNHDFKINKMFEVFNNYDKHNYLFLKHQEYDAYSKVLDIFKTAKKELIIIDNYADHYTLNLTMKLKVKVLIITNSNYITDDDIIKYNKEVYTSGASIDNIGHDVCAIIKCGEPDIIDSILKLLETIKKTS